MAIRLHGKHVMVTWSAEAGTSPWTGAALNPANLKTTEGRVVGINAGTRLWEVTPLGGDWDEWSPAGFGGDGVLALNNIDTANSGPPLPSGFSGTLRINLDDTAAGGPPASTKYITGTAYFERARISARGGGANSPPQETLFTWKWTGPITQVL